MAGVAAAVATGHRSAGAEAGSSKGIVRDGGAAGAIDGVSVRRWPGDVGTGRDAGGWSAAGKDRIHCRDRGALERRDRQDHGRLHRSCGEVSPAGPFAVRDRADEFASAVVSIDTSTVIGTLPDWEAFPQRIKKRAGNAVK